MGNPHSGNENDEYAIQHRCQELYWNAFGESSGRTRDLRIISEVRLDIGSESDRGDDEDERGWADESSWKEAVDACYASGVAVLCFILLPESLGD